MMMQNLHDVVIIGAGAGGLMAAWELVQAGKKVAVVESRNRIGGRAHTVDDNRFVQPVELGAEFVHGNLELTQWLLKQTDANAYKVSGEIWQKENGQLQKQEDFIEGYSHLEKKFELLKEDISVADFIQQYLPEEKFEELRFTLKNYVAGYYAANTHEASTFALREDLTTSDDIQYRIEGGYKKLMDYLHKEAEQKGCFFHLSHTVQQVSWKEGYAEVITAQQTLYGKKVLVTVPLGVLQAEKIGFSPALNEKIAAAKQLGFGPVIKIILQFENAFWKNKSVTNGKDLHKLNFLFSEESVPTWWTQHPKDIALLTGWLAGPNAEAVKNNSEEELLQKALQSLASIFEIELPFLQQQLKGWHVANWVQDIYACGGYAYEVVKGKVLRKKMQEPVANTLFFAGEAFCNGPEIGTVEAAFASGREVARQMIASFE